MNLLNKKENAFTLIEFLIVIAICGILMSVVLFDYGKFNDKLALSSAGQELAIAIRQAQTYGLNVKETASGSGDFKKAYGVHFDPEDPYNYYLFIDKNIVNGVYNVGIGSCGSVTTECLEQIPIRSGVRISNVCRVFSGSNVCYPVSDSVYRSLDITFLRPNPDALINIVLNSSGSIVFGSQATGKVELTSSKGATTTVVIESTGQIYAQ